MCIHPLYVYPCGHGIDGPPSELVQCPDKTADSRNRCILTTGIRKRPGPCPGCSSAEADSEAMARRLAQEEEESFARSRPQAVGGDAAMAREKHEKWNRSHMQASEELARQFAREEEESMAKFRQAIEGDEAMAQSMAGERQEWMRAHGQDHGHDHGYAEMVPHGDGRENVLRGDGREMVPHEETRGQAINTRDQSPPARQARPSGRPAEETTAQEEGGGPSTSREERTRRRSNTPSEGEESSSGEESDDAAHSDRATVSRRGDRRGRGADSAGESDSGEESSGGERRGHGVPVRDVRGHTRRGSTGE